MNLTWLKKKVEIADLEKIEAENSYYVESDDSIKILKDKLPFGEKYFEWRHMKDLMIQHPKCELWEYDNDLWCSLAGRAGFVIVKWFDSYEDRKITGRNICTRLN